MPSYYDRQGPPPSRRQANPPNTSNIPVPAHRIVSSSSSALSMSHLMKPKRTVQPDWQDEMEDEQPAADESTSQEVMPYPIHAERTSNSILRTRVKAYPTASTPRMPLAGLVNRPVVKARVPSYPALPFAKASTIHKPRTSVRRRVSGGTARPTIQPRTTMARPAPMQQQQQGGGRMDAIESQLASMQSLFDLERRRTEDILLREQTERRQQEDKVRQLEEDLLEQRRLAAQNGGKQARGLAEEEIEQLLRTHQREKHQLEDQIERERITVASLKEALQQNSTVHLTMDSTNAALRLQIDQMKNTIEELKGDKGDLHGEMDRLQRDNAALQASLRDAESLRRRLHNEIQELRGNIRVFVRVRPPTHRVHAETLASYRFTDDLEANRIELVTNAEFAMGTATMRAHAFCFDRVFQPDASQADVFDEVEHLIQSVLDGYNTCIFAYGQTGSGKTYTLEGPQLPAAGALEQARFDHDEGLIPRAVAMLWHTAEQLKSKGWQYHFEGQMLEIYNEGINDLLGKAEVDQAKHEIRHERGRTMVSDTVTVPLHSPAELYTLLARAKRRRQVAATLMNERSSRSHCVFTLRVVGRNLDTLESSDAVLNLVDLAGSERLNTSGSGKDALRLKEAQNINRSLSSLADVIAALGGNSAAKANATATTATTAAAHVPYRNSTLTWLLKNSLGGNSKTLMLLALSPMLEHQAESLCSLRFASKVNSTVIGTARRVRAT